MLHDELWFGDQVVRQDDDPQTRFDKVMRSCGPGQLDRVNFTEIVSRARFRLLQRSVDEPELLFDYPTGI